MTAISPRFYSTLVFLLMLSKNITSNSATVFNTVW